MDIMGIGILKEKWRMKKGFFFQGDWSWKSNNKYFPFLGGEGGW